MNKEEYLENWRRGYEEGIIEGVDGFTKYIISRKTKPCDKFARKFYLNRDLLRELAEYFIKLYNDEITYDHDNRIRKEAIIGYLEWDFYRSNPHAIEGYKNVRHLDRQNAQTYLSSIGKGKE